MCQDSEHNVSGRILDKVQSGFCKRRACHPCESPQLLSINYLSGIHKPQTGKLTNNHTTFKYLNNITND